MKKIAIESNVKLQFPPASVGFVEIEMDLIQNKPNEGSYEIRLIDTCFDFVNSKKVELGKNTRFKKYSYAEINALAQAVNVDFTDATKRVEQVNEIFEKGLLAVTQ